MKYLKSFKFWILALILTYSTIGFLIIPWFFTNKLPTLLNNKISLHVEINKAKFNPFLLDLDLQNVLINDLDNKPVLKLDRVFIDYSLLGLLNKTILFKNVNIESPKFFASIYKNGGLNINNIIKIPASKNRKVANSNNIPTIILQQFNIKNGNIELTDFRKKTPFKLQLGPYKFQAHDISTKKNDLNAYNFTAKINKTGELFWEGGMRLDPLSIYGRVDIKNLKLPKLYAYILPELDAILENGSLSLNIPYSIDLSNDIKAKITDAKLSLSNIIMQRKSTKKSIIKVPKASLSGFYLSWPAQEINIKNISVNDSNFFVHLNNNNELNLVKSFETKSEKSDNNTLKPWTFSLDNTNIKNAKIIFVDDSQNKAIKSVIKNIAFNVKNISTQKNLTISYTLSSILNEKTDIKTSGKFMQDSSKLNSQIDIKDLMLGDFKRYIEPFVNLDIKNANINIDAQINAILDNTSDIKLMANSVINNLIINTLDDKKLLSWNQLKINGISYSTIPQSLEIKSLELQEPFIKAHIFKNHTTNFSNLSKIDAKKDSTKDKKQKAIKIKIGPMALTNGSLDFSDVSLAFPFQTNIHSLNGKISELDFQNTTPSTLNLTGKIDKYGYSNIKGVLSPFNIKENAKLNIILKNIDLNSLTPYSGKFLGYKIKEGKLSMDLNYNIKKAKLLGANKINIDTLNLGEKVDSKDAVNLPLELALALLKDSNGQIDIDLPVTGDMNNPDFSYGGVVWRAIGNMITGIVTAPFRFLGSILGIKVDELKSIDFEKGSYAVISTEYEKLTNLQQILNKRPQIHIALTGGYSSATDTYELQKQQFKSLINKELRKSSKDNNTTDKDIYGTALKNLFAQKFSNIKIDKLKKSFTTTIKPKSDDNKTKEENKKPMIKLNLVAFNNAMQNQITKSIEISKKDLEKLAQKRVIGLRDILVKAYKIDVKRIKILPPKNKDTKRNRWIESGIDIVI